MHPLWIHVTKNALAQEGRCILSGYTETALAQEGGLSGGVSGGCVFLLCGPGVGSTLEKSSLQGCFAFQTMTGL
jgi:hypothetical protein